MRAGQSSDAPPPGPELMEGTALLIPVGPDAREPARVKDLLHGVAAFEPSAVGHVVLVDDAPEPRGLERLAGGLDATVSVLRTSVDKSLPYHAMMAGTLAGLHAAGAVGAEVVVKLDTDALVIGPFTERLRERFAADERLGVLGAYRLAGDGSERDWSHFAPTVRAASLPLPVIPGRRGARPHLTRSHPARMRNRRRLLAAARSAGYEAGEHCLGGAYAVSGRLAAWLQADDHLQAAAAWLDTELPEDVFVGILARAAGLRPCGFNAAGEPFALRHVGLPGSPEELIAARASIIHSVRNDQRPEDDLRRAFAHHRSEAARVAGARG